jgi:hypothetical protein
MDLKHRAAQAIESIGDAIARAEIIAAETGPQSVLHWLPPTTEKLARPIVLALELHCRIREWDSLGIEARSLFEVPSPGRDRIRLFNAYGAHSATEAVLSEAVRLADALEEFHRRLSMAMESLLDADRRYWLEDAPRLAFDRTDDGLGVRTAWEGTAVAKAVGKGFFPSPGWIIREAIPWALDEIAGMKTAAEGGKSPATPAPGGAITAPLTAQSENISQPYYHCLFHPDEQFQKAAPVLNAYAKKHPKGRKKQEILTKASQGWKQKLDDSRAKELIKKMGNYERRMRKLTAAQEHH